MKKLRLPLWLLIFLLANDLFAQIDPASQWPMFMQNIRHTGQTNQNVTGPRTNIVSKWKFSASGNIYYSSPAIGPDGTIYIGSSGNKLYAITNGKIKWAYTTGGAVYSSPTVGTNNVVYVGCMDGKLYAITNNMTKWVFSAGGAIGYSSPAIGSDGAVYVGCLDNKLYAVTNGFEKWEFLTGASINSSPAIGSNGTIYCGSSDGNLYAITNGKTNWALTTGNTIFISSPAIGPDNTVYAGSLNNLLYAVTNGGKIKWTFSADSSLDSSPAIGPDGAVYIGSYNGKLFAVTNGGIKKWEYATSGAIYSSLAIGSDGTIYIAGNNQKICAISNAIKKWDFTADSGFYSSVSIGADKKIYAGSYNGTLYCLGENHEPLLVWTGNPGYLTDGVSPNTNLGGSLFKFEVKYKDADNDPPLTNQVWIDLNDDLVYTYDEKFPLTAGSGSSWSNGMIYTNSVRIYFAGDGILNYRFNFKDLNNYAPLACAASSNHALQVTNAGMVPVLGWTGEPGFFNGGVDPGISTGGTNFVFRVSYTDRQNSSPILQEVWIDTNDDGAYSALEKFHMMESDSADRTYSDGKIYTFTNLISYHGDGIINYRFHFIGNISTATGQPALDHTFKIDRGTVYYIKTNGNDSFPGTSVHYAWKTIQKAGNTLVAGDTAYILAGIYNNVNVNVSGSGTAASNITFSAYSNNVIVNGVAGSSCFNINSKNYINIKKLKLVSGKHGVSINSANYNTFISNTMSRASSDGILIELNCSYNSIVNCIVCSNNGEGIYFMGPSDYYNRVINCRVFNSTTDGVGSNGQDYNTFISNILYKNGLDGLSFWWVAGNANSDYNMIIGNTCFKNGHEGIYIDGKGNYLSRTICYSNIFSGITLNGGDTKSVTLVSNVCFQNTGSGIIAQNNAGQNGGNIVIRNCTLFRNSIGFQRSSGTGINIRNCISFSNVNYGFYFDNAFCNLTYNDAYGSSAADYNMSPGTGCMTNDPGFISTLFGDIDFLHLSGDVPSPCIETGDPSDPAPLNGGLRVDMGRFEYLFKSVVLKLDATVEISLFGSPIEPVPGSLIKYCLTYSNQPDELASGVICYDRIMSNTTFYKTNSHSNSISGWVTEWSTNVFPSQSWISSGYVSTEPAFQKVRWIRWKKGLVRKNETGLFRFKVAIK